MCGWWTAPNTTANLAARVIICTCQSMIGIKNYPRRKSTKRFGLVLITRFPPVGPGDQYVSYVPTQIIAEQFLADGFDGIAYKSALSKDGYNVALFDVQAAELTTCQLFNVTRVDYDFEEWSGPWFLQDGRYFTQVITDIRPLDKAAPSEDAADDTTTDTSARAKDENRKETSNKQRFHPKPLP
jgi:hypothetical protein